MRYLAIDHGTKHCGFALLRDGEVFDSGHFELFEKHPVSLRELSLESHGLIEEYCPDVIVLEKPMQLRGGNVAQVLIEHFAVIKLEAVNNFLRIVEVSPPTMKLHVAGSGKASKDDVAWAVSKRFGLAFDEVAVPVLYKDKKRAGKVKERLYDTADAIGLAWAAYEMDKQTKGTA